MSYLLFIGGLLLILCGANFMTDGAGSIARKFGMSDLIVGLTIVSMMTSAPEFIVSLTGALNASTDLAIGNVVGSNVFNILVIVGISALIKPIKVESGILSNEIPMVILSAFALMAIAAAPWLDGSAMEVTRVSGILLLLFYAIFMRYIISKAKNKPEVDAETKEETQVKVLPIWKSLVFLLGGLVALVVGGNWFVDGASGIARSFGLSDAIIGLTIVAAGTSLPELATSVAAALKGSPGICIGNVIGSNIFNIFFILGSTSLVKPLQFGGIGMEDMLVVVTSSVLFWLVGWFGGYRIIKRYEGALLVMIYVAYVVFKILTL